MAPEPEFEHLVHSPRRLTGWTPQIEPEGELRCLTLGHEIDSALTMPNGLLVGYCSRCSARFEMPWIQGGTVCVLAERVADEASAMTRPDLDVRQDLHQVLRMMDDDMVSWHTARNKLLDALRHIEERLK